MLYIFKKFIINSSENKSDQILINYCG